MTVQRFMLGGAKKARKSGLPCSTNRPGRAVKLFIGSSSIRAFRPRRRRKHTPFRVNMGPSRIGRRSPYWVTVKENTPVLRAEPHTPDAVQVQDTWAGIELLYSWRDARKDAFKSLLMRTLDAAPKNLVKAGYTHTARGWYYAHGSDSCQSLQRMGQGR